jgi:hypothetical protein
MADNDKSKEVGSLPRGMAMDGRSVVPVTPIKQDRATSTTASPNDIHSGRMPIGVTPLTPGAPITTTPSGPAAPPPPDKPAK